MRPVVLGFFLFIFSALAYAKPIILLDAGSSGTRVYIYEVDNSQVQSLHNYRVKPGLSSLNPGDTLALDKYFSDLMQSTEKILSPSQRAQTPIYLYATAGVRMMPPSEQVAILAASEISLNSQAQKLGYPPAEEVRAITGTEEAAFIWASDNYLNGNLNQDPINRRNTVLALEMGGASSEIAFLHNKAKDYTKTFVQAGKKRLIYGYAYDGLGANAAVAQMLASGSPDFAACFPVGAPYPLATGQFTGTGNLSACTQAIKAEFIDPPENKACEAEYGKACSQLGVYQPALSDHTPEVILSAGFYYLFDVLGLANQPVSHAQFTDKAQAFCGKTWDEVKELGQDENLLIHYCFNAGLTQTLLDAWHVKKEYPLHAVSSLNNRPLEWPLGAALFLSK